MELRQLYELWDKLGKVVFRQNLLAEPFLHFQQGVAREEIWNWFEDQNSRFVVAEVMEGFRLTPITAHAYMNPVCDSHGEQVCVGDTLRAKAFYIHQGRRYSQDVDIPVTLDHNLFGLISTEEKGQLYTLEIEPKGDVAFFVGNIAKKATVESVRRAELEERAKYDLARFMRTTFYAHEFFDAQTPEGEAGRRIVLPKPVLVKIEINAEHPIKLSHIRRWDDEFLRPRWHVAPQELVPELARCRHLFVSGPIYCLSSDVCLDSPSTAPYEVNEDTGHGISPSL